MKSPAVQEVTGEMLDRLESRKRLMTHEARDFSRRVFRAVACDVEAHEGYDPFLDGRVEWCLAVIGEARFGKRVPGDLRANVEFLLGRGGFAAGRCGKMAAAGEVAR